MDKKWILIIIILIVGCFFLHNIVDSSTTVGNAITVVNKSVVTLPDGFSIGESEKNSVELLDEKTGEKTYITDLGKTDSAEKEYNEALQSLEYNTDTYIIDNYTSNINNTNTYLITFENHTVNTNTVYLAYIYSCNHTFRMEFQNYYDNNGFNDDLNFIVSTISPDFKQSQD
jgi:hypothetical protein